MPGPGDLTKYIAILDRLMKRTGSMGLSIAAMREYVVHFNQALRIAAPTLTQFGINMDDVRLQSIKMAQEFNIAPEAVMRLYDSLEKGFISPPLDQINDGLRVARAMFGYSSQAATKFFDKMEKVASLGPQFEEFVANFVELQSAELRDPGSVTAELEKQGELGRQALQLALFTGKIEAKVYRSRIQLFNLTKQQNAFDKERKQLADTQAEAATKAGVIHRMSLLDSETALSLQKSEAEALVKYNEMLDWKNMSEKQSVETLAYLEDYLKGVAENMDGGAAAAAQLRQELMDAGVPMQKVASATDHFKQALIEARKNYDGLSIEQKKALDASIQELNTQELLEKVRSGMIRSLKAANATQKAITAELGAQMGKQEELNYLIGIVGEQGAQAFGGMTSSYEEQLSIGLDMIENRKIELGLNQSMQKFVGEIASTNENDLSTRTDTINKMREYIAQQVELTGETEETKRMAAGVTAIEEGGVEIARQMSAEMEKQVAEAEKGVISAHKLLDFNKQIAAKFEFQRETLNVITEQAGLQVQVADNLAKGVGASVEMRLKEADAITAQIHLLERQKREMATAATAITESLNQQNLGEQERVTLMATRKKLGLDMQKLENDTLNLQLKQVAALKQLRDGFIDAISAMTTGAGVFNEIIIDQDKNMGAFIRTTGEAVSVLRTGAATGAGATASRHGIGGFMRGRAPTGDYDIAPQSMEELISQTYATREALGEGGAISLGMDGLNQRQLEAITAYGTGSDNIVNAIEGLGETITGGGAGGAPVPPPIPPGVTPPGDTAEGLAEINRQLLEEMRRMSSVSKPDSTVGVSPPFISDAAGCCPETKALLETITLRAESLQNLAGSELLASNKIVDLLSLMTSAIPTTHQIEGLPVNQAAGTDPALIIAIQSNAKTIGLQIADLLEKSIIAAQRRLVEDGFLQG